MLDHPKHMTRDTALYEPFRRQAGAQTRPQKLQLLAREHLGWAIQDGTHNPAEDAVAALRLYKLRMADWERVAARRQPPGANDSSRHAFGAKRKVKRGVGKPKGGIGKGITRLHS